jgi:hypothetical protein
MKYYLFAKLYRNLDVPHLMALCQEVGLDGPTALIREGYWTQWSDLLTHCLI